jgi:hypothetical protein
MESNLTTVEWLIEEIEKLTGLQYLDEEDCVIKAKEMEKQQIIDAYRTGFLSEDIKLAGDYYNEKFNK